MRPPSNEHSFRYYCWAVAASLAITELTSWGILFYSFSVMVTPISTDLGWSAGTVTGAFAIAFLISGLSAIVVGRGGKRRRRCVSGKAVAQFLAVVGAGRLSRFRLRPP